MSTGGRLRVLHVIHGYPPYYMAGSEVYTAGLVRELAKHVDVAVFTRTENPFESPYSETDAVEDGVLVRRVNKPARDYTFEDKYLDPAMDEAFRRMVAAWNPDIVHVGHLSHLSTNIVGIAKREYRVPVVFTIHDFWMFCYRGQLVDPDLRLCGGPGDETCLGCAARAFKDWIDASAVASYRRHMHEVARLVDLFLAPSRTVERFYLDQGVPASKVVYSPYGFEERRAPGTSPPAAERGVTFGFLGRVIPVKGVAELIRAFRGTTGPGRLRIHGSANGHRAYLEELGCGDPRLEFCGAYDNHHLGRVLSGLDVVVVPSLWLENAPLVIQEAHLAGVPVIASDAGGMAELVRHGRDGFLFPLGDGHALRGLLQGLIDHPGRLAELEVEPDRVRRISDDAIACIERYRTLCSPRRLTIVTNPGLCNLTCPMCDTHSIHAGPKRRASALPILDWDLVESTVRDLARLGLREVIPSTMGEPLMYPRFEDLLLLVRELGLTLNLTTNGTFPGGGVERWAPLLLPVLSDMKVSLNAVTAEVNEAVMVGANTARQLANLEAFLHLRDGFAGTNGHDPTVTVQATFMETNLADLPALLRWAIARGVDRFKGHHLWVTWPELRGQSLRRGPESARRWNEIVEELRTIADTERRPDGRRIELDNVVPLADAAPDGPDPDTVCPFLGREAWLEADGSFQVCCCPSKVRREFGEFGNVRELPLRALWSSTAYRDFVAAWGSHPNCRVCNMRRPAEECSRV